MISYRQKTTPEDFIWLREKERRLFPQKGSEYGVKEVLTFLVVVRGQVDYGAGDKMAEVSCYYCCPDSLLGQTKQKTCPFVHKDTELATTGQSLDI